VLGCACGPGFDAATATNAFGESNVNSIVLEGPDDFLGTETIGFWGVTALATDAGGWRQINRCAQPMMNTIFNPDDSQLANDRNAGQPSEDPARHGPRIADLVGASCGPWAPPPTPRTMVAGCARPCFPSAPLRGRQRRQLRFRRAEWPRTHRTGAGGHVLAGAQHCDPDRSLPHRCDRRASRPFPVPCTARDADR
jgi:hypothetical protein